jgi:hypothetical protein
MREGPEAGQPREQRARMRVVSVIVALAIPALTLAILMVGGHVADAQTRRGAPPPKPAAAARGSSAKADAGTLGPGVLAAPVAAAGPTVAGASSDAGVVEAKTLDGGTHVFKFSELDIEGRLKSPQLVYFLRRVRAEFAAGELGHRSFMREMSETRKESTF